MPRGRRFLTLASLTAVLLFVAATATAAIPDGSGVFNGCVNVATGVLRVIDPAKTGALGACITANGPLKETPISWNQTGPAGQAGQPGSPGPTGPQGPRGPSDAFVTTQLNNGPVLQGANTTLTGFDPLLLPQGTYVVTLDYDAIRSDTALFAEMGCLPTTVPSGSFGQGIIGGRGVLPPGIPRMTSTIQTVMTVFAGDTGVSVRCGLISGGTVPQVDVSLIALQIAGLTVQN